MIKIVVADDEEKVCLLICSLIDWQSLDMEIVGVAHNGIEALSLVQQFSPDILITDIRMPGCDGIELIRRVKEMDSNLEIIIISGYRYFEYAQNAVKNGVKDYLLKPIKKEDLLRALNESAVKYRMRLEQLSNQERREMRQQNDANKLRSNFFTDVLFTKEIPVGSAADINEVYHYAFREGQFQIVIVKLDCGYDIKYDGSIKILRDKMVQIMNDFLKEDCLDYGLYSEDCRVTAILNYKEEDKKQIRKCLKNVLDELSIQKNIFQYSQFTIGLGNAVEGPDLLRESLDTARRAVDARLIQGTQKLIEQVEPAASGTITGTLLSQLDTSVDAALLGLNKDDVLHAIDVLLANTQAEPTLDGRSIYQIVIEAFSTYILLIRNHQFEFEDQTEVYDIFCRYAQRCGSADELFGYLRKTVGESLDTIIEDKKQADTRPIRLAKQYIQANYMNPITLEIVGREAGFSTTYFSSLFKKETGRNFLEYLSQIRMEKAKELLKDTNLSIAMVCEKVGYSDLKHFTKSFRTATGVKPNEYRKLYS